MIITIKKTPYKGLTKHHHWLILGILIGCVALIMIPAGWVAVMFSSLLWMEFLIVSNDLHEKQGYERATEIALTDATDWFCKALNRIKNDTKTIEEWAEELPPMTRGRFLDNAKEADTLEREYWSLPVAINWAFYWSETKEWHAFWRSLHNEILFAPTVEPTVDPTACCAKEVPDSVNAIHKCRKHGVEYTTKRCNRCQKEYDSKRKK